MKRITIVMSALVLAILFACSGGKEEKSTAAGSAVQPKIEKVRVMSLETRKIAHSVEYTATLQGYEEVHLAPASPGRIEAIYVEEGSRVARGISLPRWDTASSCSGGPVTLLSVTAWAMRVSLRSRVSSTGAW